MFGTGTETWLSGSGGTVAEEVDPKLTNSLFHFFVPLLTEQTVGGQRGSAGCGHQGGGGGI